MKTSAFPKALLALLCVLTLVALSARAQEQVKERYIESNWGVAAIDGEFIFPGTSILMGKRIFFNDAGFVDAQIGLAFPTLATAKVGVGKRWNSGWSVSSGVRLWPLHAYVQTGIPTQRCNRDISKAKLRRLERRGKGASDIKCTEWAFSFELSPYGVLYSTESDRLYDWDGVSALSLGMMTIGRRWLF